MKWALDIGFPRLSCVQVGVTHILNCSIEIPNQHPELFEYRKACVHILPSHGPLLVTQSLLCGWLIFSAILDCYAQLLMDDDPSVDIGDFLASSMEFLRLWMQACFDFSSLAVTHP